MYHKKNLLFPVIVLVMVLFSACSPKAVSMDDFRVTVDGGKLPDTIEMIVGDEIRLDHSFVINGKDVKYAISEPDSNEVVSLSVEDKAFVLKALSKGSYDVSFKFSSDGYEDTKVTIPVTVNKPELTVTKSLKDDLADGAVTVNGEPAPAAGAQLSDELLKERQSLIPVLKDDTLTMTFGTDAVLLLESDSGTTYTVSSSDDTVAAAEADVNQIRISALKEGTAKIKIDAANDDYEPLRINLEVIVTLKPIVLDVTSTQTDLNKASVEIGGVLAVNTAASPADAAVTVVSDNDNVTASYSRGIVTIKPNKLGTSEITITAAKENYQESTQSFEVTVTPAKAALTLDTNSVSVEKSGTVTVNAVTLPNSVLEIDYSKAALEVVQNGKALNIKGLEFGEHTIKLTAKAENYIDNEKTITVFVTKSNLIITPSAKAIDSEIGQTSTITLTVSQPDAVLNAAIDNNIASVSINGNVLTVSANKTGSANITVTAAKAEYGDAKIVIPVKITEAVEITNDNAKSVLNLINKKRKAEGLSPLKYSTASQKAADIRAKESEELFSHTRPNGKEWVTALSDSGVKFAGAGENLASGFDSPASVVQGWMDSPGHRENIMRPEFTAVAIGIYTDSLGTMYWSQLFTY